MLPNNQISQDDATQILAGLLAESVDMVIADPPYLVSYRDRTGRTIANDDAPEEVLPAIARCTGS